MSCKYAALQLQLPFEPSYADACKAAAANADATATEAATTLIGAAAQCVHLLYGLELPMADEGFTEGYQVFFL